MIFEKEIEFKTLITKEQYEALVKEFNLKDNVYCQINHYFDTPDLKLHDEKIVLRIRQKGENYKLTKKVKSTVGNDESHILLTEEKAQSYIKNGFNADIIDLPLDVVKVAELTTYRTSTFYKHGKLFFDRSEYYGHIDYEIEYEAEHDDEGKHDFIAFMKQHEIEYKESPKKSVRAFEAKK